MNVKDIIVLIIVFLLIDITGLNNLWGENFHRRTLHHCQRSQYNPSKKPWIKFLYDKLDTNTINFITGHVIAVNPAGTVYSAKIESAVFCDGVGAVSVLSSMTTVIKDDIPTGQSWAISPLGAANRFSYSTTRAGTTNIIKWIVSTQVISIAWA